jgi:hypothetical protein
MEDTGMGKKLHLHPTPLPERDFTLSKRYASNALRSRASPVQSWGLRWSMSFAAVGC